MKLKSGVKGRGATERAVALTLKLCKTSWLAVERGLTVISRKNSPVAYPMPVETGRVGASEPGRAVRRSALHAAQVHIANP